MNMRDFAENDSIKIQIPQPENRLHRYETVRLLQYKMPETQEEPPPHPQERHDKGADPI